MAHYVPACNVNIMYDCWYKVIDQTFVMCLALAPRIIALSFYTN